MSYVVQLKEERSNVQNLNNQLEQKNRELETQKTAAEDDLSSQLKDSGFGNHRMSS